MISGGDPNRSPLPAGPIRLNSIKGYSNRTNNVIYCPPLIKTPPDDVPTAVVYFGGDVQDVPENMEGNRDTKSYLKYNLENTAILLRESFPRAHIIVVQPARMEYTTFSCFDNFVRGNCAGIPDHTPMHYALQHLEELLSNISKKLTKIMSEAELISKLTAGRQANLQQQQQQQQQQSSVQGNNIDHSQEMDIDILQVQDSLPGGDPQSLMVHSSNNCETNNEHVTASNNVTSSDQVSTTAATVAAVATTTNNNSGVVQNNSTTTTTTTAANNSHQISASDILWWREGLNLDKANLSLVGFSKGCVVLNQFIYEFHYLKTLTPDDSTMMRLVSRIKDMYWLDGGHGGGKNTWITSRSLLETLCRLGINIHVHVTPYQVQDDHRPWIRKEEKAFTDLLKRLGANLTRNLHASDTNVSNLFTHFEVLHGFKKYQLQLLAQQFAHHQAQLQLQQQQQLSLANQQDQFQQGQPDQQQQQQLLLQNNDVVEHQQLQANSSVVGIEHVVNNSVQLITSSAAAAALDVVVGSEQQNAMAGIDK